MERNIVTSFSFLSTIIVCLLFNLSLINGALRRKTDIAMEEKSKLQQLFGFLNSTARIFREVCRETDLICRWGGEEFLFLFIDSPGEKAAGIADRIRQRIKETKSPCECGIGATISVGVTEYKADLTLEQLINRADEALYRAKNRGKDRIELY